MDWLLLMKRDPLQPRPLLQPAEALAEAHRCNGCVDAPCQKGCPLAVDVGAFIRRIQTAHWAGALRVLYERNPLPETCSLICPVETLCQGHCNNGQSAYPIRIAELQQAAAHYGTASFLRTVKTLADSPGAIAIVGGGPAGLACAARLRIEGFEVHLFEKTDTLGGALASAIPAYRLPRTTLQAEIQRIIDLGVTVHTRHALGQNITLDDLRTRFRAVFLALGLGADRPIRIPGRTGPGVLDALRMLESANARQLANLPEPVVIIGGGNTAIDAAVTARYLGASDVYLVYRRSFTQMPAWPGERHRAIDLGIHVLILIRPIEYLRDPQGHLIGVRCLRTRLQPGPQGHRDLPTDIPGSEFVLEARTVIQAAGQQPDELTRQALASLTWRDDSTLAVDPRTSQASLPGVYAAGDLVNGGQTAAQAIAEALRAADAIQQYVRQQHRR